jgi:hypothetical protein
VVAHTYGASEIGIVSALTPPEYDPEGAHGAGRIHPGVEVRFRAADGALDPSATWGASTRRGTCTSSGARRAARWSTAGW